MEITTRWLYHYPSTSGRLAKSPSELKPVCEVGASVEVTYNTTEGTVRWYITILRIFNQSCFNTQSPTSTPLIIDSSTVSFTRLSAQRALPLIAMVRINHVSETLNGTVINCTEVGLNLINPNSSATRY